MFFPMVDLFFRFDRLYVIWSIEGATTVAAHRERTRSIVVVEYDCLHIKQALSSNWREDDSLECIAMFIFQGTARHVEMRRERGLVRRRRTASRKKPEVR